MKKVILIVVGFLLILGGGAYLYISTIDWNKNKGKIAEQFSIVLGKDVVFDGPVSFQLLPSPYLSASDIKIYSKEGENKNIPLAKIKKLVASLSLFPLLSGDFKVERMSIVEPEVVFEVFDDGKLNWQSQQSLDQEYVASDIAVSLDSVTIEKATVNFLYPKRDLDYTLENLTAEVIAQSISGPYRIEGSYIKDGNPEGFAIDLGQFSESFPTSLSLALTQPVFETYMRFEGSVLFKTDTVNGNVVFESNKLAEFINRNFKKYSLSKEYDHPLMVSLELNTSASKVDLANIVMKYGETMGAGSVSVPLPEQKIYDVLGEESDTKEKAPRTKVDASFNMTELDLAPVVSALKAFAGKYSNEKAVFSPDLGEDYILDLHAVKANYNGESIRDLDLSVDVLADAIKVQNFDAKFPGDTSIKTKGNLVAVDDVLTYSFENKLTSADLAKFSSWLGYNIHNAGEFTYKKASGGFNVEGNLKNIKISPIEVSIDKTVLNGEIGVVYGDRKNLFVNLSADTLNFDNYVEALPSAEKKADLAARMAYRFSKLGFLNGFDARGRLKVGLGIYENMPFENTSLDFDLKGGVLTVEEMKVGSLANTEFVFKGNVKGFGAAPYFENLKYEIDAQDFSSLLNKFEIPLPNINLKELKSFSSKGIVTGNFERAAAKMVSKLGNIDNVFGGEIAFKDGELYLNGDLELKAPDFVKMVNNFNYKYSPSAFSLGLFALKTKFVGSFNKFKANDVNTNIGSNNFQGAIIYDATLPRPSVVANLAVNRFEVDRFLYMPGGDKRGEEKVDFKPLAVEKAEFLAKPMFSKDKFNYSFYNSFDLKGKFKVLELIYKGEVFRNAEFDLNMESSNVKLDNFKSMYGEAVAAANMDLSMINPFVLKGNVKIDNLYINDANWGGSRYGLRSGKVNYTAQFNTNASSWDDVAGMMEAQIKFYVAKPEVKGWNLTAVYDDLKTRDKPEGLAVWVNDNLQKGETSFESFVGNMNINKGGFMFRDALFSGNSMEVRLEGAGNLLNWDMNTKMKVKFPSLQKVPEFFFTAIGPIDNPKVTADVSAIVGTYNQHWAKVEADKKAEEQERLNNLNNMMSVEQQKAFAAKEKLEKGPKLDLEAKKSLGTHPKTEAQYKTIDNELAKITQDLDYIFSQALVVGFDESVIDDLERRNAEVEQAISNVYKEIAKVYMQDVKLRINDEYNKVVELNGSAKVKSAEYREKIAEFPKRLIAIGSKYDLDEDENAIKFKTDIENALLDLDDIDAKVSKEYINIQAVKDVQDLEDYVATVKGYITKSEADIVTMDENIQELLGYAETMVAAEEAMYRERLKAEEVKKKLEENVGKISAVGGKDITVQRDIDDIVRSEKATTGENVKILDFSKPSSKGSITTSTEKKVINYEKEAESKEEGGFLKEYTGEVVKSGGVIRKE